MKRELFASIVAGPGAHTIMLRGLAMPIVIAAGPGVSADGLCEAALIMDQGDPMRACFDVDDVACVVSGARSPSVRIVS